MLTPEQQALRRTGIGGSEIAAVAGLSPWAGPIDIWQRKLGIATESPPSAHMLRGTYLEPAIIEWYSNVERRDVTFPGTLVHPEHRIVIATPDGIAHAGGSDVPVVLEVKCPSWRARHRWGEPGTDDIPDEYLPQILWEMAVTGLQSAHICALLDGELRVYHVPFASDLFGALLEIAERFWRDYVMSGVMPPDNGKGPSDWLCERYPENVRPMRPFDPAMLHWVEQLRQARIDAKDVARREKEAADKLKDFIGDHEGTEGDWGRITWRKNRDSEMFDAKAMRAAHPEIAAKYIKTRPGARVFLPRLVGECE